MNAELKQQLIKIIIDDISDDITDFLDFDGENFTLKFQYIKDFDPYTLTPEIFSEFTKQIKINKRDEKLKQILK
jgi:cytochrome b involved in lipid metabolism